MKSLEKAFDPSILAAFALGPKTGIPTGKWSVWATNDLELDSTFAEVCLNAIDEGLLRAWYYERYLCEVLAVASCNSRHTYIIFDREFYESGEISGWNIVEVGGLGLKLGARISWGYIDVVDVG